MTLKDIAKAFDQWAKDRQAAREGKGEIMDKYEPQPVFINIDLAKGAGMTVITVSRQMIVDAFNEWLTDYLADPEAWTPLPGVTGTQYGEVCADELLKRMQQSKQ